MIPALIAAVIAAQPAPPPVEWIKPGEVIIRDPHGFDPNTKYNRPDYSDPHVFEKDTFTWA